MTSGHNFITPSSLDNLRLGVSNNSITIASEPTLPVFQTVVLIYSRALIYRMYHVSDRSTLYNETSLSLTSKIVMKVASRMKAHFINCSDPVFLIGILAVFYWCAISTASMKKQQHGHSSPFLKTLLQWNFIVKWQQQQTSNLYSHQWTSSNQQYKRNFFAPIQRWLVASSESLQMTRQLLEWTLQLIAPHNWIAWLSCNTPMILRQLVQSVQHVDN